MPNLWIAKRKIKSRPKPRPPPPMPYTECQLTTKAERSLSATGLLAATRTTTTAAAITPVAIHVIATSAPLKPAAPEPDSAIDPMGFC